MWVKSDSDRQILEVREIKQRFILPTQIYNESPTLDILYIR